MMSRMDEPLHPVQILARRCAESGLGLKASRMLFNTLYAADSLAIHRGNITQAAKSAGVERNWFKRLMMPHQKGNETNGGGSD